VSGHAGTRANGVLEESLLAAVPLWMDQYRGLHWGERARIASECAQVVASQGDTLQYGGSHKFGHGAGEVAAHQAAGRCPGTDCGCAGAPEGKRAERRAACTRCANPRCWCQVRGEPTWSAGEVFNFLARGLALLAYEPGGVTWLGLHWCARPRPWCPAEKGRRAPACCTCDARCPLAAGVEGNCPAPGCPWCQNGCREDCGHLLPSQAGSEPPTDEVPLIERVAVAGERL
jgi:hypothetical protein